MAAARLPDFGTIFVSVLTRTKQQLKLSADLAEMGYVLLATEGTANVLKEAGLRVDRTKKCSKADRMSSTIYSPGMSIW